MTPDDESTEPRWPGWLSQRASENLSAFLLAIASLATAWSGYQASVWSGIQAREYTVAMELRTRSAQVADEVARIRMFDLAIFTRWLEAHSSDRERLALMYERHFRPEFRPAFTAWRKEFGRPGTEGTTPFTRPEYRLASAAQADRIDQASTRAFRTGQVANDVSDGYVFDTVILATVLFFAGAIRPLVAPRTRGIILLIAIVLCVWAIARLVGEPVAR